jgi:regulator of sigma E protease
MQMDYGSPNTPLGIQPLGIACPVENRVHGVVPGSPAAREGLQVGDELLAAQFVAANPEQGEREEKLGLSDDEIELGENLNWMGVFQRIQMSLPDTGLKLKYKRGSQEKTCLLTTEEAPGWYIANRGFFLKAVPETHVAASWGEAFQLGLRNTWESLLHVFKFLRKLVTGQISPTNLGGPILIASVAGMEAKEGIARLLLFLTLLSANLAIINFLPIPVLDGGHMLFLLYEAVVGKPVNEVWAMRLTVAGLIFILGLMFFVLSLDVYHLAGWFS